MDKVKVVWFIQPFAFEILHNELDIWGHPIRLDRADVIPNDVGAREFPIIQGQSYWYTKIEDGGFYVLGNVQGPNTCSSSQVKNVLW